MELGLGGAAGKLAMGRPSICRPGTALATTQVSSPGSGPRRRVDLALLGRTGSAVRTAVKRLDLPRVGGSPEEPFVDITPFCKSLSTFVWAVANGCRWQLVETCGTLARGGHLEVLMWAREQGWCSWGEGTCRSKNNRGFAAHLQRRRPGAYTRPLFSST
jgi:hypothetical protein